MRKEDNNNSYNFLEIVRSYYLNNKQFMIILFFAIIIRLFTFFLVLVGDTILWMEASSFLIEGINPYEREEDFFYKYPPLFYYILTFFGLLTNYSYLGPKLMIFFFDILNIFIIYKIGLELKGKVLGTNITLFYALNPVIILQFFGDTNEFVSLFFSLLSIYFLIKEKIIFSSISLSLGIGFKLYPIFFLIPITLYIYRNWPNRIKKLFIYYIIIIIIIFLICLPFLIISPEIFLKRFFIHTSRMNLGNSLTSIIPELLYFYRPAFIIFGITFSYQFIIQVCVLMFIFLFFFFLSEKNFNIYNFFTVCVIISLVLPLINYQIQFKYFFLLSYPFLLILIYNNMKTIKEMEIYLFFFLNCISIIFYLIIYIILYPPISNLINPYETNEKIQLIILFCIIDVIFYTINDYRYKDEGDYKIYLLNFFPLLSFYFINNYIGGIFTMILICINIFYVYFKYNK
ncbi:MAG: hypothetical protein ACP6IY_02610 [Promethearchaeia archaeon]